MSEARAAYTGLKHLWCLPDISLKLKRARSLNHKVIHYELWPCTLLPWVNDVCHVRSTYAADSWKPFCVLRYLLTVTTNYGQASRLLDAIDYFKRITTDGECMCSFLSVLNEYLGFWGCESNIVFGYLNRQAVRCMLNCVFTLMQQGDLVESPAAWEWSYPVAK